MICTDGPKYDRGLHQRVCRFGIAVCSAGSAAVVRYLNDIAVKIASNIIVIILNYIVSKFVIFAKKKRGSGDD